MAKHVYSISSYVERNMGTFFLHPFSAREKAASNVQHQTVPWPINGTITSVEVDIGSPVAGTDTELTAAPLVVALFKNEVIEATSVINVTTFNSKETASTSITVNVGDRLSIRLQETTPGTTWKGYVNVRFVFETLFRGTIIGGGTGESALSGLAIGFQRIYPSIGDIDVILDSGIARMRVPQPGKLSDFHVYRQPTIGGARFSLSVDGAPSITLIFADGEDQQSSPDEVNLNEDSFVAVDAEAISGIAKISWSAYMISV